MSASASGAGEVFVGAIDQGTTSTRFLIFDRDGQPVASHQIEFKQIYPQSGWHEHDPLEIIKSVEDCIDGAVAEFKKSHPIESIKAVGITNQRETTVVWDNVTGEPLHNAVVWTDTRAQQLVRELKTRVGAGELPTKTGLPLSTYPSVSKLLWLIENAPRVQQAYYKGRLAFGTIDTWVVYKLNGGASKNVFVTEPTNASRTMFMNIHTLKYDDSLLDFFGLDRSKLHLPRIIKSSDPTAYGSLASSVLKGVRITGCLGDQSAALVGQKGFKPGMAKSTYGTGSFLLYNVGTSPVISSNGLLATVAYAFDDEPVYALEGSIAVAGSSVKFLMNNLGFIDTSDKMSELCETVDDNGGCVFVTAFSGLFAPYWIDDARGTIFGITAYTQKGHIARATLEATCFQTKAILDSMEKDSGQKLKELAVDGGMSNSDLCMQIQSDLIGIPVIRPKMRETTALGAAIAAGFSAGVWKDLDEVSKVNTVGSTIYKPLVSQIERDTRLSRWTKAVEMCRGWTDDTPKALTATKSSAAKAEVQSLAPSFDSWREWVTPATFAAAGMLAGAYFRGAGVGRSW